MESILISINPQHVENIFNGTKRYEYRKIKGKRKINKMLIYSTYPIKKVVGEAQIEEVLEGSPEEIWEKTKQYSGVEEIFYNEYFKGKTKAIAYKLKNVKKYNTPKELSTYGVKSAPQSFVYVD